MTKLLCVGLGGGIGSLIRYGIGTWIQQRWGPSFPYATLIVNISGAFLIGLLMTSLWARSNAAPEWRLFLIVGILGGFTTFSALAWESYDLLRSGQALQSVLYVGGSVVGGAVGIWAGVWAGRWF